MKRMFYLFASVAILIPFSGCRGCGGAPEPASAFRDAQAFLAEQGIDAQSLRVIGADAFITYEASEALEYDHQLAVVWGTIMGALAEAAPGTITIVNTAGGRPAVIVKAQSADVRAFKAGQLTFEQFVKRLQISPAEG